MDLSNLTDENIIEQIELFNDLNALAKIVEKD